MTKKSKQKLNSNNEQYKEEISNDAFLIASYFGFQPIKSPRIENQDVSNYKQFQSNDLMNDDRLFDLKERVAVLRCYNECNLSQLPQPVAVSYKRPLPEKGKRIGESIGLDVFGLSTSAGEALILRTAISILEEAGFENLLVELNCTGDKESFAEFEKHVGIFVRKNINSAPAVIRKLVKKNIFSIYDAQTPEAEEFIEQAPKSLAFLSETSRSHFKEVLEYVESFGVTYFLNTKLIGHPKVTTNTIFQIRDGGAKDKAIIAQGMRYSKITKKLGLKKETPAVGVSISWKKSYDRGPSKKTLPKKKFYLVQLGFEAKLKALNIIESLRRSKISVFHSLSKDKLTSQLAQAENMKFPYVIIMGHKESLDGVVIVRDMNTRVQEIIPAHELAQYIKKLK